MKTATDWNDFEILETGKGEKKERWGNVCLLRPDPQIIWGKPLSTKGVNARYVRSANGGGGWKVFSRFPDEWTVSWKNLTFLIKPMGFKHTGLFPEQAVNWNIVMDKIKSAGRPVSVLNLFAYTGGATVACASAGASVVHVDSAKNMVERAKKNVELSGLAQSKVRYIVDDCNKFIDREIRRGNKYDAIIMDPPSYGRGVNGEVWKLEDQIFDFVLKCTKLLSDRPLFVLINSYTTGLGATTMKNVLVSAMGGFKGVFDAYEVGLPTNEDLNLPCGSSAIFLGE